MIHYGNCPLCGSMKIGLHLQTNDFFLTSEPFSLFRCSVCGFVFTQDHPDEENIGKYYASENYLSHNDSVKGLTSSLYRLSRNLMLKRKRAIVRRFTGLNKGNLLDIGSGTGHFLLTMMEGGWKCSGVETNDKARDFAVKSLGVDIIPPGQLLSLPGGTFDCITLWHVLEHFHDPFRYATEILRLLKTGGVCIIALPNFNSYDEKHYRKFWAAYDVPRHVWHFSPFTLQFFAQKSGFSFVKMKSLPLDVFYISMLSEKYKKTKIHFISGLIRGAWFSVLSFFNKKKNSSLIYILKKPER